MSYVGPLRGNPTLTAIVHGLELEPEYEQAMDNLAAGNLRSVVAYLAATVNPRWLRYQYQRGITVPGNVRERKGWAAWKPRTSKVTA